MAVIAGGLLGAPARYLIAVALSTSARGLPTATWVVNVAGAFVVGLLLAARERNETEAKPRRHDHDMRGASGPQVMTRRGCTCR
jgi:CrcB protein